MSDEAMWRVTLTREATAEAFVVAATREDAQRIARDRASDLSFETDYEASAYAARVVIPPRYAESEYPINLSDDDGRTVAQWMAGAPKPADALETWKAARPTAPTLTSALAWLGSQPGRPTPWGGGRPAWLTVTEHGAAATNGEGMLFVDGATLPDGMLEGSRFDPARVIESNAPTTTITVTPEAVAAWLAGAARRADDVPVARVLGCEVNAELVSHWALPAIEVTACPVEVSTSGPLSPVVWRGPGWTAVTMPRRVDAPIGPELEQETMR